MIDRSGPGTVLKETRQVRATLRLLVLAGLVLLGLGSMPGNAVLYWSCIVVYALTIPAALSATKRGSGRWRLESFVFLFDVVAVTLMIILRGVEVQTLLTAYFTLVLIAALVDGLGNALFHALFVSGVYLVTSRWGQDWSSILSMGTLGQCVFFFVVALFMGHMAQGARAEAQERRDAEEGRDHAQNALQLASTELRQSTEDLRLARESLRSNDHLFTLGMLSAGIAHEMKNPIAAILASVRAAPEMIEDLEQALEAGEGHATFLEELREALDDCGHACEQLQGVTRDLGDMVRGGRSEVSPIDPSEALLSAVRLLRPATAGTVTLEHNAETERTILADPGRLLQVLINLGKNAIDAMHGAGGGTLHFEARDAPDGGVVLSVRDTGPGIPEDVRAHMFEPFFTTKGAGKGSGMGLHLVSEIIKSQKGTIECETKVGTGTTFLVRLPALSGSLSLEKEYGDGHREEDPVDSGRRAEHSQSARADAA